ncbi:hypothetical protein Leryth_007977 [Lithospermum erythrorhizon]|nr:hypothetical protein Leryth_007977 [Lithospermum erythrorhizon]
MEKFTELKKAIESVPLIDAHAHNIVALDSTIPFISCFSEASGDALSYAPHTLCFKRSLREVAELYGSELSFHAVERYRTLSGLESITETCFRASRLSAILIDDGLELDKMHDIDWHRKFVPLVGRILRIEHLAEKILNEEISSGSTWTLDSFTEIFVAKLKKESEKAVGFKSIAAYRGGLEINPCVSAAEAEEGLFDVLKSGSPVRITNKNFIDHLFVRALEVAKQYNLPMQVHTGFGDTDLDLRQSNPLNLRKILEDKRFSNCLIVLLHASYPFMKEASYLASVYSQVYLDFGLAVPKLSMHGMISSVKELLELAPVKKVMFSTDGCAFPEAFYLGAKKAREVVYSALCDACTDGDLTIADAIELVEDIFIENSKSLYKLNHDFKSFAPSYSLSPKMNQLEDDIEFVRIIWVDASGQTRCRGVPKKRFDDSVVKNGVGLPYAIMAFASYVDGVAIGSGLSGTGEMRLIPDLSTKHRVPWEKHQEMVMGDMQIRPGEPWEYCPREALRRICKVLKEEFNLVMNTGFEVEFYLLKNIKKEGKEEWVPFDRSAYCSTSGFDAAFPVLKEIVAALNSLNIIVEQVHAESGTGQFELSFSYTMCTTAADNMVFTHEVIKAVARKHGLLATFLPKYSLDLIGSGSHVHVSVSKNGENVFMARDGLARYGMTKIGEEFMAGVLHHLPSILAFIAPLPNSYDRLRPNTWSGAYLCWGKENKAAPIRTACPPGVPNGVVSNFEIKSFDGCANPYLGLAAIAAAGIDGLRKKLELPEPIEEDPDSLTEQLQRLPKSLSEAMEALDKNDVLKDFIGEKLLVAIQGVRNAEIKFYSENPNAYKELIHTY